MDLRGSYPVRGLGLAVQDVRAVLRVYLRPPQEVRKEEVAAMCDGFAKLPPQAQDRLHAWMLGVRDALRLAGLGFRSPKRAR